MNNDLNIYRILGGNGRPKISQLAMNLLKSLPLHISTKLLYNFENIVEEEDPELVGYFQHNSEISRLIRRIPGDFRMLERIYTKENIIGSIDEYFYNSLSGLALRNRLQIATSYVIKVIRELGSEHILNLGCGSARDTIKAKKITSSHATVCCVDIDEEALSIAKKLAGLESLNNFHFINQSLMKLDNDKSADLGLLIGTICYLSPRESKLLLYKVKRYFREGAVVVATNVMTKMIDDDPFTSYLLDNVVGMKLNYKTPDILKKIFEEAGYEWIEYISESLCFHGMGVGVVKHPHK